MFKKKWHFSWMMVRPFSKSGVYKNLKLFSTTIRVLGFLNRGILKAQSDNAQRLQKAN
jgi:hypothetical protein